MPDGVRALSTSGATLRVWDLNIGRCLRTLEGHLKPVASVVAMSDGLGAVSASSDGTLRVWDVDSGRCLRTIEGHTSGIESVAVTADGWRAVSASFDDTLRVWDLQNGRCIALLAAAVSVVTAVPGGDRFCVGTPEGDVLFYDVRGL